MEQAATPTTSRPAHPANLYMVRFGEAIYERRDVLGISGPEAAALSEQYAREDPATYAKFSQQTLSRWEMDKTGAILAASSPARIRSLARVLQWTPTQFTQRVGVPAADAIERPARIETDLVLSDGVYINVYGAGTGPAWGDTDILDTLYIPGLKANHDYIGLKATGDSMSPYLTHGDVAIIHRDEGTVQPGDYCAVWLSDDGCVVKRLVQELDDGTLLLESLNPSNGEPRYFQAPPGSRVLGKVIHRLLNG